MAASVSFVGTGRVGTSLARRLHVSGIEVRFLADVSLEAAEKAQQFVGGGHSVTDIGQALASDIVFISVPDGVIEEVCREMDAKVGWEPRHTAIHCSGALDTSALVAAQSAGAAVLSMHPIQSVASVEEGAKLLEGAFFGLEGSARGLEVGKRLVNAIGGRPLELAAGGKAAYHAAAVMASNYVVALVDLGLELMQEAGLNKDEALAALLPLLEGTVRNIKENGIPGALTGPIERGDVNTVLSHLQTVAGNPELQKAYTLLGRRTLALAEEKNPKARQGHQVIAELLREKENGHGSITKR